MQNAIPYILARGTVVVQSLSHVWLFATPWTATHQASLSFTISQSLLRFMSIESVMLSNHLILCGPLLLLPSIFPRIRVFSNELALLIRFPAHIGGLELLMIVTSLFILLWQEIFHVLVVTVPPNIFKRATSCHYVPNEFGGHWRTLGRCAECSVWAHSGCNPRSWDWA